MTQYVVVRKLLYRMWRRFTPNRNQHRDDDLASLIISAILAAAAFLSNYL